MADPAIRRLFRREAVAAAKLTHSNIVSVFDTGEHNGAPFIVMEYLGGGSLRDRLAKGRLEPQAAAKVGAEVCAALNHAHKVGIIHGNIRPENVLFTESGHLKVSDFAIAKVALVNSRLTDPGGTQAINPYAAPEVALGAEPDVRSDLFSVGAILYEAVVGKTPATAAAEAAGGAVADPEHRPPTPGPRDLRPGIPEDLDLAIIGALQRDPSARFQTARSLERTLRPLAPSASVPPAKTSTTAPRVAVTPRPQGPAETQLSGAVVPPPPRHNSPPAPREDSAPSRRAPRGGGDSFLRAEGRWLLPTLLVIAAAALVFSIPALRSGIGDVVGQGLQPQQPAEPIEIAQAFAYDPPPGDGEEGNRRLGQAIDGDPQTSWATSSYSRPPLGGLKDGVGIYVDLGAAQELSGIRVTSVTGGWMGTVRFSDDGRTWSDPGNSETVDVDHTFEVSGSHRYWMIWITELVRTEGEGNASNPYAVAIREIEPLA